MEKAVGDVVDPAVERECLAARPGFAHNGGLADILDLLDYVELAQAPMALRFVWKTLELGAVLDAHVLNVAQPVVEEPQPLVAQGGKDTAAAVMSAYDDMSHSQHLDRERGRDRAAGAGAAGMAVASRIEFAEVLLNRDDIDAKADAFIDFLSDRVIDRRFDDGFGGEHQVETFADLDRLFRAILDGLEETGRSDMWRTHHIATIRKVRNRLSNTPVWMNIDGSGLTRVSNGEGRTTCGYFYDHDRRVLFSSTHLTGDSCPPPPDYSQGYVWSVHPGYDIFTARPDGSDLKRLTTTPGYDAEATVSADGRTIVFTSVRDGDLDLYTMRTDGTGVTRLTDRLGYDGGAFFSRDGRWICWRAGYPDDSSAATYRALLARHQVRPSAMDLWVMRSDGSGKRQVTFKPGASFAPYFTPDGKSLIYSSNWENPRGRNFDLYLVGAQGGEPVPVTRDPTFDGFPMFSPDGGWLVFSSNRGARTRGETNLFLAEWRP